MDYQFYKDQNSWEKTAPFLPKTLAVDNGAAAHFVGRKLLRVVVSRPDALGYTVQSRNGKVTESPLPRAVLTAR